MPSITKSSLFGLLASVAQVSAHGYVEGFVSDGAYYKGYDINNYPWYNPAPDTMGWTETNTDLGFVAPSSYSSSDIICHKDATNGKASVTVQAGSTILVEWSTWPDDHHGPVIDYLASCNGDCTTVDKTTLQFFKIAHAGLIDSSSTPGTWATDKLIANNNSWSVTIPSTIAAGKYVLRTEIIALHSADTAGGAQNYPQCLNLEVTGGGSDVPSGTAGVSLYKSTDAGILVDIWNPLSTYIIPGPALYTGGSSGATATAAAVAVSASSVAAETVNSVAAVTESPVAAITESPIAAATESPVAPVSVPTTLATKTRTRGAHSAAATRKAGHKQKNKGNNGDEDCD